MRAASPRILQGNMGRILSCRRAQRIGFGLRLSGRTGGAAPKLDGEPDARADQGDFRKTHRAGGRSKHCRGCPEFLPELLQERVRHRRYRKFIVIARARQSSRDRGRRCRGHGVVHRYQRLPGNASSSRRRTSSSGIAPLCRSPDPRNQVGVARAPRRRPKSCSCSTGVSQSRSGRGSMRRNIRSSQAPARSFDHQTAFA